MDRLIQAIERTRAALDRLRRHSLKETATRTIIIDPFLEALGWDVRDPDEVQLEYPTVDGKAVDYALKINGKAVLLVEAKALDDPLADVKAVTQVVGYAANDGIVWCVLTNGIKWRVYRSVEKCPAPDKLMFEVSVDPRETEGVSVLELARLLWRISLEEMAKGTLDGLGEQTFTDGKIRKVLDSIMRDPPRSFLSLVRNASGDPSLSPQSVKRSLARVWAQTGAGSMVAPVPDPQPATSSRRRGEYGERARKAWATRRSAEGRETYDETHHVAGKPQEVLELYRFVDQFCFSLGPGVVEKRLMKMCMTYLHGKRAFCWIHILQGGLKVWLPMKFSQLAEPPGFARDVTNVGHWGGGDVELIIHDSGQAQEAALLIRQAFELQQQRAAKS